MPKFIPSAAAVKKLPVAYISKSGNLFIKQPTGHCPTASVRIDAEPSNGQAICISQVNYFEPEKAENIAVFYPGDELTIKF